MGTTSNSHRTRVIAAACAGAFVAALAAPPAAFAQAAPAGAAAPRVTGPTVELPPEYVIGADDVLGIVFWRDTDMTGDVTVRPDGKITLPLLGDMTAVGLTPEALKEQITKAASKLIEDPTVTVVVRAINSRKVYITGQVVAPKDYALTRELTVMQLISLAGGLTEYANKKNITVLRTENGQQKVFKVNYNEISEGKNLAQNIVLKPGDTVLVR
ncbi:MAG TPA: polysaccharide biosynthesis/export family protein [Vicinamibacterales bacterium]|nr:polysaccharide biosynthesis/export family protein [Vicinamibacterales bacterium]